MVGLDWVELADFLLVHTSFSVLPGGKIKRNRILVKFSFPRVNECIGGHGLMRLMMMMIISRIMR